MPTQHVVDAAPVILGEIPIRRIQIRDQHEAGGCRIEHRHRQIRPPTLEQKCRPPYITSPHPGTFRILALLPVHTTRDVRLNGKAVMQGNDRVFLAIPLRVEEVAQKKFASVHAVEEGHVYRAAEQTLDVILCEKIVALGAKEECLRVCQYLLENMTLIDIELRVNGDRGAIRERQGAARVHPHFKICCGPEHTVEPGKH